MEFSYVPFLNFKRFLLFCINYMFRRNADEDVCIQCFQLYLLSISKSRFSDADKFKNRQPFQGGMSRAEH
jgi:hypothetical protein